MSGLYPGATFGPDDPRCIGAPAFTSVVTRNTLTGVKSTESAISAPFTPKAPGTYRWIASYAGDANNSAVTAPCNAANESVLVTPGPAGSGPALRGLSISPASFRAAGSGPSAAAGIGSRVSYRLSEVASVTFRVERALAGRRMRGRCARRTSANPRAKRCLRYVTLPAGFTRRSRPAENTFRFTGRLRGPRLTPSRYRLRGAAFEAAGSRSPVRRVAFRIRAR